MTIRVATAGDAGAMTRIAAEAYEIYISRMGRRPAPMDADFARHIAEDFVLLYADDQVQGYQVQGYVVVVEKPDYVLLENVAVAKSAQGKGLGTKLIAAVERELKARGVEHYQLYTNEKMTENLAYYPRLGFVETKRVEEDGFRRVYFVKHLT